MKYKSTLGLTMSGSMDGITGAHNRGGQYFRRRAVPSDPGTTQQGVIRNFLSGLTSRWNNVLTAVQREAWDTWAELVPFLDSQGDPRNIGGIGAYIGYNVAAQQGGLVIQDDAPTVYNRGDFTAPAIVSITAPTSLSLSFDNTDAWANEDGSAMVIFGSRGVNPSVNFFKGPYRFAAAIDGDSVTAPTSPAAITMPFVLTAGQKAFIRGRVLRADGRWSSSFRLGATVI